jgi:hypothetical protein
VTACFLHDNYARQVANIEKKDGWPFLIFLINFDDHEFDALEIFLKDLKSLDGTSSNITLVNMKGEVAKRSD